MGFRNRAGVDMSSKGLGSGVLFASVFLIAGALSACGGGSGDSSDPAATTGLGIVRGPRPDTTSPSRGSITRGSTDPTIQGVAAASVAVGQNYSFQPTANDSANEMLTFNISNKPSWLSFNASTGLLSGTPTASNVGTYANIEISVTDGSSVAALPAFSIIVAPPGSTGTVTLSWDAPTENSNGTPLVNLGGYKVYYG